MSHAPLLTEEVTYTPEQRKEILKQPKWKYCKDQVDPKVLDDNFEFLNQAVVIRGDAQGIPLMTTSGIYGPIGIHDTVLLHQDPERIVTRVSSEPIKDKSEHLLHKLKKMKSEALPPKEGNSIKLKAKWVSGTSGGILPGVDPSANVFGITGSLFVRDASVEFPILDHNHPDYESTMKYYGAKIIKKDEPFYMGFDKPLFGMEYDTSLPGYVQDYVMKDWGGGGLFVEHHPFPHIWFPNPHTKEERKSNVCRVLLGRVVPSKKNIVEEIEQTIEQDLDYMCDGDSCTLIPGDAVEPEIEFTIFEIPTDGRAIAVDECCIHNDSFCNGKQVVFIAHTNANTVALRETAPYSNIRVNQVIPEVPKG